MIRETRQVWVKRVEQWNESGLTAREFAAEIGVNPSTLASWRWRLREESRRPMRREPGTPPPFVEVIAATTADEMAVAPMAPEAEPLELIVTGGHRLCIPVHFDGGSLRRVLAALEVR